MAVRDLGIVTAYGYAVEGGYTGTEQEFTALLGDLALTVEDLENMTVSVTTLEPNQQATASYADGVLSLGIPKGVAGEVQFSDLEPLAEKDGNYENFTAGSALQLISDKYTENKEPYLFRKSIAGDRELDTVVGGSIAFNQLAQNGNFADGATGWTGINANVSASDGILTATATSSATRIKVDNASAYRFTSVVGHKYFISFLCKPSIALTQIALQGIASATLKGAAAAGTWHDVAGIANCATSGNVIDLYFAGSFATSDKVELKNIQTIDLTQMFGSSVADYIYALEQATTGAGVAFFRAMFPKDYYQYNTGELMSVKTTAHEMVGFNQWDEEWESGYWDVTTGEKVASDVWRRCANYIPVFPNTDYYFKVTLPSSGAFGAFAFLDSDKKVISYISNGTEVCNTVFTTPANAMYLVFYLSANWFANPICISISSDRNGEYQPYTKHTYALDDVELRGVMKLDGTPYFDGDTYEADGTVTRKYGIVDLGTLNWNKQTELGVYFGVPNSGFGGKPTPSLNSIPNIATAKYTIATPYETYSGQVDKTISVYTNGSLIVRDSAYSDQTAAAFKTAMSGVYLVYELATPTTETADPYTSPQIVDAYGTERYVDERTVAVPVGHVTKYPDNLREKLDGLPWDFSSLIAPTEKAYTATRNYTAGSLLIVNNTLYKVTANIANGGAITPNTNVVATTLSEVISAL